MKRTWDGVLEDDFSQRFMLQLKSEAEIELAITKVANEVQGLNLNSSEVVLNINFHVEASIIYVYPCKKNDLIREVKVRYIIQLCYLFKAFEQIEEQYYDDANFYELEHNRLVHQYLSYVYPRFSEAVGTSDIDIIYTEQRWTDESGLSYMEIDVPS